MSLTQPSIVASRRHDSVHANVAEEGADVVIRGQFTRSAEPLAFLKNFILSEDVDEEKHLLFLVDRKLEVVDLLVLGTARNDLALETTSSP